MASIGFGRNKQKSQTSGTSEVSPYAPTEGAIGEIINQAGNLYNQGQPDFLGGFDYSNDLFADPTNQMLALESQGANLFNNLTPTSTLASGGCGPATQSSSHQPSQQSSQAVIQ